MSKYNEYARKLNDIAKGAFTSFQEAEEDYTKARKALEDARSTRDAAKIARASADEMDAKKAYERAKNELQGHGKEIALLRNELSEKLEADFAIDPSTLDASTLEVMKAGIMEPSDYRKAMNKAQEEDNVTMLRMIGHYAKEAADKEAKQNGQSDMKATSYRNIANECMKENGNGYLSNFDALAGVFDRTTQNTAMISHWDTLTSDFVNNF